ncbi:MAG TPA: hypothetical protein PLC65_16120 [Bacteroidia bacterium]|nr:hypothetical protein [Bacteroidia bacterium]
MKYVLINTNNNIKIIKNKFVNWRVVILCGLEEILAVFNKILVEILNDLVVDF